MGFAWARRLTIHMNHDHIGRKEYRDSQMYFFLFYFLWFDDVRLEGTYEIKIKTVSELHQEPFFFLR